MARHQVLYWKHIPSQVKAWDEQGEAREMLPPRFQLAIDSLAMRQALTSSEEYLEGWHWGAEEERAGPAREVARAVARELEEAYPQSRLVEAE